MTSASTTSISTSSTLVPSQAALQQQQPEWVKMDLCDMGKSIFNDFPLTNDRLELKKASIETSLALQDHQLLMNLTSTREGLLTMDLRRKVWHVLLKLDDYYAGGSDPSSSSEIQQPQDYRQLPHHKDEDQVKLDIERSFVYWPKGLSNVELQSLKKALQNVIINVLRQNPDLNYYQGYHDVASVFLIVFNKDEYLAAKYLQAFTMLHLRDFMLPQIEFTVDHLKLIPDLLTLIDPNFGELVSKIEVFYSISSILTLYSHNFKNLQDTCLMWDFIICQNSMCFPIYIFTSMLVYYKKDIFTDLEELTGLTEQDIYKLDKQNKSSQYRDFLFSMLSNVIDRLSDGSGSNDTNRTQKNDFFEILQLSIGYITKFPPNKLKSYNDKISVNSVWKTSSNFISSSSSSSSSTASAEKLNERAKLYTRSAVAEIFQKQLQESKELQIKKDLERERREKTIQNNKKTAINLNLFNRYLKSATTSIKLRNKKLKLISSLLFKVSIAIGILSILLKYYQVPISKYYYYPTITTTTAMPSFFNIQKFDLQHIKQNFILNGNGYNLTNLKKLFV